MDYQNNGVNHPKHYKHRSGFDAIVWIDRYSMDFETGSCFKYLFRCGSKDGESLEKDQEKALWYFIHESERFAENTLITWEEAKQKVFNVLAMAFGPPGRKMDENGNAIEDWSKGGCDMPEAIEFLKNKCLIALRS